MRVKFTGNSYSYRTCVNVNGHHWNTGKLVFTRTCTQVPGLVLVLMWTHPSRMLASMSCIRTIIVFITISLCCCRGALYCHSQLYQHCLLWDMSKNILLTAFCAFQKVYPDDLSLLILPTVSQVCSARWIALYDVVNWFARYCLTTDWR